MTAPAKAGRIRQAARWCAAPVTGRDGRLSYAKLVTIAVLGLYARGAELPSSVAICAIAAAHGTKVLVALVGRGGGDATL